MAIMHVISNIGFKGRILVPTVPAPGHFLSFISEVYDMVIVYYYHFSCCNYQHLRTDSSLELVI